jgi:hypothetical protein
MRRNVAPWLISALLLGCATQKKDVAGSGDDRYDETSSPERAAPQIKDASQCGPDGKGDLVLLDARTAAPVACSLVTVSRQPDCQDSDCAAEALFQGRTNAQGLVLVGQPFTGSRIYAVAEGYAQSYRQPSSLSGSHIAEIEMLPDEGYLLKVVDGEGNYLPGVEVTFKQGEDVLSKVRTNDLANVFFQERTPFGGQPVTIAVDGYSPVTVAAASELGSDGHTVTVKH